MNKYVPEAQVTVVDSTGGPENVERHRAGTAQLSHMTTDQAYLSANGLEAYEGEPYNGIRVGMMRSTGPIYFAVRADSGVESFSDLQGKRFSPGFAGSATYYAGTHILKALGIEIDEYSADLGDAVDAVKNDEIVGFVKSGANPDANLLDLASVTDIRLLSLTPDELKTVTEALPFLPPGETTVKGGTYKGIPDDVTVNGLGLAGFVGLDARVPQELGYKLMKATWEHWDEGIGSVKGFKDYDAIAETLSLSGVPLHSGTVQYLKELGEEVPDDLIPDEYRE